MFKIDFGSAIAVFLILDFLVVISLWLFYTYTSDKEADIQNSKYFRQCPYCCVVFFDYQKQALRACPQCKSLIGHNDRS